jgi:hypothetical protein
LEGESASVPLAKLLARGRGPNFRGAIRDFRDVFSEDHLNPQLGLNPVAREGEAKQWHQHP